MSTERKKFLVRYHDAVVHGGTFSAERWGELVQEAKQEQDAARAEIRADFAAAVLDPRVKFRKEYVQLMPGQIVVRASEILGAEATIAEVLAIIAEFEELGGMKDVGVMRGERLMQTLKEARERVAERIRRERLKLV